MKETLYTLGYAHPDAKAMLQQWMTTSPNALLVDIRLYPQSRWSPQWSKQALQRNWGDRYTHLKALGNVNYRSPDAPVALLDAQAGLQWIQKALQDGHILVLLCACRDYERCHRKEVVLLIEKALVQGAEQGKE